MCMGYECPIASCQDTLMPYGQCCSICGATITMEYGNSYQESTMKQFLQSKSSTFSGTHVILSKIPSKLVATSGELFSGEIRATGDIIQIVITDENSGTS